MDEVICGCYGKILYVMMYLNQKEFCEKHRIIWIKELWWNIWHPEYQKWGLYKKLTSKINIQITLKKSIRKSISYESKYPRKMGRDSLHQNIQILKRKIQLETSTLSRKLMGKCKISKNTEILNQEMRPKWYFVLNMGNALFIIFSFILHLFFKL